MRIVAGTMPTSEEWVAVRLTAVSLLDALLRGDVASLVVLGLDDYADVPWLMLAQADLTVALVRSADMPAADLLELMRAQIVANGVVDHGCAS